jgi:hypothetical protein
MSPAPRWVRHVRASLLVALGGHAVANALLDEDQFTSAGLEYTWGASIPLLVQAAVLLAVVAGLGPVARRARRQPSGRPIRRVTLWAALAASQVAIFGALEISERLVQHEPFAQGLLGSGFSLELVFALAAATLLAAMANVAVRVARALDRLPERRRSTALPRPPVSIAPHPRLALIPVGVRAPPMR